MRCSEDVPDWKRPFFVFAHGTSLESASLIRENGLDAAQAKLHQRGSPYPGSFYVFELGPPEDPGPGFQFACNFGVRQTASPVVLIGELPREVFQAMLERRHAVVERILYSEPEDPDQVVFFSAAFEAFNLHRRWRQIVHPRQR